MSIESIKIENVLSFENLQIVDMKDMNCIVGRNNVGKSNLLKALKFFYNKLEEKEELPPKLHSNYSYKGKIAITFDTTRIFHIARKNPSNSYFSFIIRKLIPLHKRRFHALRSYDNTKSTFTLTLNIYNDGSVKWSTNDKQTRNLILYLFPFFHIEPRHMDLHEWDSLWDLISRLKSFNLSKIDDESVIEFFDKSINTDGENSYHRYVNDLNSIISTKKSTQKEKILSYIKAGLKGYKFEINESDLKFQSDGTNSFHFITTFLKILITISRREYITPFVFIDEPELGLHPKMNEVLVNDIYEYYKYEGEVDNKVTRPKVFITTHSQNIVKEVIKKFRQRQSVLCFQKANSSSTTIHRLKSTYNSESFINIFSDNEARLFFSSFILFVEGETELEVFGNMRLIEHFPHLRNIDIYKCSSNIIGERVNPSYSNSSIPYLFLFDADKAWNLAGSPKQFTLDSKKNGDYFSIKKKDLKKEHDRYKLGFSKKYSEIKNDIYTLMVSENMPLAFDLTKQNFHFNTNLDDFFKSLKSYMLQKNCYINNTTFEGCLINESSSPIFYEWLKAERNVDMSPILSRVSSSNILTDSMLVDYMRVIFKGKTKILSDYKSFNLDEYDKAIKNSATPHARLLKTSRRAKLIMKELEKRTIASSNVDKTNGWTTSFLNFAVNHIENEMVTKNSTFGSLFKIYFPELYDIIRMLQPDSRGEI
ncbi:AAA family ATPase [Vibrio sp. Y2-5]|uniref:retron Eco8 family effector endonuclease n=1 Tax=Vibrio sp. Y2-5 TaxID=2743977 RepID=UPI0016601E74|nr:retron Eco8 family effector endonuclease [Vibrio sp. Y2-5]MBD0785833.1 AAA family ATPase [Vibrio sp. Y2-5]